MEDFVSITEELLKASPVLVTGIDKEYFKNAEILPANIASYDLGIVNTSQGLEAPEWFVNVTMSDVDTIVIDAIDSIDMESQEKFYELLKYKTISSIEFNKEIKIIVLYEDLKKVSPSILSLCQIMK